MLIMNIGLTALVVFLMRHVQDLLSSDVRITLTEVVTQNKDAITSRLTLSMRSLDIISSRITESMKAAGITGKEDIARFLDDYARANNTTEFFVSPRTGIVPIAGGSTMDISGRKYFRLALAGTPNISDKLISRMDGTEIFIVSTPLYYKEEIIGSVQRLHTYREMYQMCSPSLFSAQGFIHVINSEGYIILHSVHPDCHLRSDNYFRDLFMLDPKAATQIKEDIQQKRTGFLESVQQGQDFFSAYAPIDKAHDWYLITTVPTNIVSSNGSMVIKLFYAILLAVALTFTCSATFFLWYKNKQRAQLEKVAFVDSITDGNTYNKFLQDAPLALQHAPHEKFFIVKFDIDNFKYINKFYGFEFGDSVLRRIVDTLTPRLLPHECLARISGDHFVMLLCKADGQRITTMLDAVSTDDTPLYFSVGVYAVTDRKESINLMVDKAATAAQTTKGVMGKQIVYYTEEFDRDNINNEQLKRAVALGIENSEFIPFFQPKVDINTGALVGCEALARWRTPDGTLVPPIRFIPMSEQTGIIVDIDLMIYEKVLQFLKKNIEAGHTCVPVSVNFSRLHLLDEIFFDKVVGKLKEYNVPASLIELELTESAIFDNVDNICQFTERMHSHGLLIAMDDFGSGYSSLNMLKDVPIDILKIDKGFLDAARDNARRDIIFSSIVVMARKLHIRIVVEGVEYIENVELMRECGCSVAQGYYFAKPMPEKDFDELMLRGHV